MSNTTCSAFPLQQNQNSRVEEAGSAVRKLLLEKFPEDYIPEERLKYVGNLGAGEFGRVDKYGLLESNMTTRSVALKLLNRELLSCEKDVRNFLNEMRVLRQLEHPSIASYLGTGVVTAPSREANEPLEHIFLAQECCEGKTIQDIVLTQMKQLPRKQIYTWSQAVSWMLGVCSALQYMHEHEPMVIHRDLKPANIIIVESRDGGMQPKLVDFGLHKVVHFHSDESIRGGLASLREGSRHRPREGGARPGEGPPSPRRADGVGQLLASGGVHVGTNGSVHARRGAAGIAHQAFRMTGGCGSLVYMAPEVHLGEAYNHSIDVFSVALIFWEVFAFRIQLTLVPGEVTIQAVTDYTMKICSGYRPPLPKMWPKELRVLLAEMWEQDFRRRPSFGEIVPRLRAIAEAVRDLEARGRCPGFQGVLPGMALAPPKAPKGSAASRFRALFRK